MITDPDYLKHDRKPYERPGCRFRCGRESQWQASCSHGPNPDGTCGGTTECAPFKNAQGRFECRRPAGAGGLCAEGPNSDGRCSHQHPPCAPKPALRELRGRLAMAAVGLVVAAIVTLLIAPNQAAGRRSERAWDPLSPGPLSAVHATATQEQGCVACHAGHPTTRTEAMQQAVMPAGLGGRCGSCHAFGGLHDQAHNAAFADRHDLKPTNCVMCHTEHRGREASLVGIKDAQCQTCHKAKFDSFTMGHPAFSERFPHERRTAVQFDHAAHLNQHFKDARVSAKAPQSCTACHTVSDREQLAVQMVGFAQSCTTCHAAEIVSKPLVVFRLPELTGASINPKLAADLCGMPAPAEGAAPEPVSSESPTTISALLLGAPADDPEAYSQPVQEFVAALAKDGVAALAEKLDERAGEGAGKRLLAGLSPEVVRQAACAWLANQEYEPPAESDLGGWHAEALELRYTPSGHADPVMKAWIEAGIRVAASASGEDAERATSMREHLISRQRGPGRCTKCHAVTEQAAGDGAAALAVEWTDQPSAHPNTVFSHGAHLNVLAKADACLTCHQLNEQADYAGSFKTVKAEPFASNFHPIKKETCLECHGGAVRPQAAGGQVRQDCLLCHTYHPPGLRQTAQSGEPATK